MKAEEMLPPHLRRYVVEQDYSQYSSIDQAVWRFLIRQLKAYFREHAHPCYLDGMRRAGLSEHEIPRVAELSRCLAEYGWRAVPVSGFVPPAAFMEMQALGYLPIGVVMRRPENMLYTSAPDIVHEAAGHAPIIVDPDFSSYLHRYAHIARKAIISRRDLELYKAIRELSDIKEEAHASAEAIAHCEQALEQAVANIQEPSEAAILGRLNWWTVEYGLVGSLEQPKIYGAGLLSSLGEARWCLQDDVQKMPFGLSCLEYSYDITEPQPQLFVSPDFETLSSVLDDLSANMAYRRGGMESLQKIIEANTVNTVEMNSGVQISGILERVLEVPGQAAQPAYLQFTGPVQLSYLDQQLPGHGRDYHRSGYGTPFGKLRGEDKCLSNMSAEELVACGIMRGQLAQLTFGSGVQVEGVVTEIITRDTKNLVVSFANCCVSWNQDVLFDPAWGTFDMALGSVIPSVFGGPADHVAYGETDDFVVSHVKPNILTAQEQQLDTLYAQVRAYRQGELCPEQPERFLQDLLAQVNDAHGQDWLLKVEILECAHQLTEVPGWADTLYAELEHRAAHDEKWQSAILDGLALYREV